MKDGGPAFPCKVELLRNGSLAVDSEPGMSLRDWLAGQALPEVVREWYTDDTRYKDAVAAQCYKFADAMIAERERANPKPQGVK